MRYPWQRVTRLVVICTTDYRSLFVSSVTGSVVWGTAACGFRPGNDLVVILEKNLFEGNITTSVILCIENSMVITSYKYVMYMPEYKSTTLLVYT